MDGLWTPTMPTKEKSTPTAFKKKTKFIKTRWNEFSSFLVQNRRNSANFNHFVQKIIQNLGFFVRFSTMQIIPPRWPKLLTKTNLTCAGTLAGLLWTILNGLPDILSVWKKRNRCIFQFFVPKSSKSHEILSFFSKLIKKIDFVLGFGVVFTNYNWGDDPNAPINNGVSQQPNATNGAGAKTNKHFYNYQTKINRIAMNFCSKFSIFV